VIPNLHCLGCKKPMKYVSTLKRHLKDLCIGKGIDREELDKLTSDAVEAARQQAGKK